jgi:putative transposase
MKYQFIEMHRSTFRVKKMCRIFTISRSGYYGWKKQTISTRKKENEKLIDHITTVYRINRQTYGSPRITKELNAQGISCGKNRIARLMSVNGIQAKTKRRYKVTTHSHHRRPTVPNLLKGCSIDTPNTAWVSDITYIRTYEGWLYLAAILDVFSRSVVGWSMGERLTDDLVIRAFTSAVGRRKPGASLIFHSDRGSQYASHLFRNHLAHYGISQSMSAPGNCYDNAMAESFFATLKTELGHSYASRSIARQSIFEYIEVFYNRIRRHSALNYVSPLEYERNHMVA